MNTVVGGFLTAAIITVTLGYAIASMIDLINREDPIINENIVKGYYGTENSEGLNLRDSNQKMAIAVLDEIEENFYYPSVNRFYVNYGRGKSLIDIPVTKCTDEDFD